MPVPPPSPAVDGPWARRRAVEDQLQGSILAAGLGRRMEPLTRHHLPKPLFPLGGRVPMAEVWVQRLVQSGIRHLSMNLCVLAETIRDHFRDGAQFGATLKYVEEEVPTGTLGGVCKQALGGEAKLLHPTETQAPFPPFGGSTLVVPSGDIVTDFGAGALEEMYDIHTRMGAAMTLILVPVPWDRRKDFGTVELDRPRNRPGPLRRSGRIERFLEKDPDSPSNLNNASIYMIEMDLVRRLDPLRTEATLALPRPFYDFGKHVFAALLGRYDGISLAGDDLLWGVEYDGAWFDVGQKRDYLRVNEVLLRGELAIDLPYEEQPWGYLGSATTLPRDRVTLTPPVVIGNDCVIEPGAHLGPYAVVGDGWVVGRGARIRNAVLWQRGSYFTDSGEEIPPQSRLTVDGHEVRPGVSVEECIVAGGTLSFDLKEQTVLVDEEGELRTYPIDFVPREERA